MSKIIIGILICLSSLWLGFWIDSLIPVGHWANVPTFATIFSLFITGLALLINGLVELEIYT